MRGIGVAAAAAKLANALHRLFPALPVSRRAILRFRHSEARKQDPLSSGAKKRTKKDLTWLLPSTMLTMPPAAVTATAAGDEFVESSSSSAATPSEGVALASAGDNGTHGEGSIYATSEERTSLVLSGEVEKEKENLWKKN